MTSSPTSTRWQEATWIAFDTETTGRYPVESEICEIAAVKWQGGREVGTFQALIKPSRPMGQAVIRIHGITNEMVADAPNVCDVLPKFLEFIKGGVLLAHHAQFDLGFTAAQIEGCGLALPPEVAICTSLLAQATVSETANHKLQTLVPFFGIDPGQAHRALDDARSCLGVAMAIFNRLQAAAPGEELTVQDIAMKMKRRTLNDLGVMRFSQFSMSELTRNENIARFVKAAKDGRIVEMAYAGGSRPGQKRWIKPIGIIRQLEGDALVALEISPADAARFSQMSLLGDQHQVYAVEDEAAYAKRYWVKDVQTIS